MKAARMGGMLMLSVAGIAAALTGCAKNQSAVIEDADKVVIEGVMLPETLGKEAILNDKGQLDALRRALETSDVAPSSGMVAATLTFYKQDKELGKIWVYEGGEWGFEWPGSSRTQGRSTDLWKIVKGALK